MKTVTSTEPNHMVVFRAAGVGLVLDCTEGRLPAVLHWGADPGPLTVDQVQTVKRTGLAPVGPSDVGVPVRVALVPEHAAGWVGHPGLTGSRDGAGWSPRWRTTRIEVTAEAISESVSLAGAEDGAPALVEIADGAVTVTASDPLTELELQTLVEFTSAGVVRMRAILTNLGAPTFHVDELLLSLPVPNVAREVLDLAGRWGKERVPQRTTLNAGLHRREGRHGRTGADAATTLMLGTPGFGFRTGEVWAIHTAFSGNHVHQAERSHTGVQLLSGGELLLGGEIRLQTHDTYETPWIYGIYGHGLDDTAQRTHRMLRDRPQHPKSPRPVTLNVWEAVYFDHDLEALVSLADIAADLGVERFVLDDGWFGSRRNERAGLGDWVVSPDVWPDGLGPLVDHVTGLGMQFGLWFEPEMVNPDSDLARAHPEWIMATGTEWPLLSRHQQVLNIGIPECYEFILDSICAILDEHCIGYIKWDHNRDLIDAGTQPSGAAGVHNQTLAFYRMLDELKTRYPHLEIESCSSGGARVDLEVLQRTERIWASDNNDPLDRQQINLWTSQLVPWEMIGAHVASGASHTTGRYHDLSFRAVTALFGHFGVEWDLRAASPDELDQLRQWIQLHKTERALLHSGNIVRMDHPDETLHIAGVVAEDQRAALFSVVSLARAAQVSPGPVRIGGLDPAATYRVEPILTGDAMWDHSPTARWWGLDNLPRVSERGTAHTAQAGALRYGQPIHLTGRALETVGVLPPALHPEHGILLRLTML